MKAIGYDVGTTGFKAALYEINSESLTLLEGVVDHYPLNILPNGGAEQDAENWWQAMCRCTRELLEKSGTAKEEIKGIACCSQCQTVVMVDEHGNALRPAMSIMDTRAEAQFKAGMGSGFKVAGLNASMLLKFVRATSAAPLSAKDSIWRYNWIRDNEPEIFNRTYKWLDTKEYLNYRATGRCIASEDDAYVTFLYDINKRDWNPELCRIVNVEPAHLPDICASTSIVGELTEGAAEELGLAPGTPVIAGGNDVSLCQVGSGALLPEDVNICSGTSGWVCTNTTGTKIDVSHSVAAIVGADPDMYLYMADCETAGKCMEWALERLHQTPLKTYDDMMKTIEDVPAGSHGVIFSPWMHGNRCPFEDANARGLFFNIDVDNHTGDLIKAAVEGVCMHMRWLLEVSEAKVKTSPALRFSGGSAMSPLVGQILSDCLGREIEVIENPRQVGTLGAAAVIATALGVIRDIKDAKELIPVGAKYEPNLANKSVYDRIFPVFKSLYKNNKKAYQILNQDMGLN